MGAKRPAFQFYPGDWLRSTDLRLCSVGARGLWIDMLCFMHEGNPYGHLKVADKVILPVNLASMVGADLEKVTEWLGELEKAGVFSLKNGCIISRRMIRDEKIRESRAKGGILGGNPALIKDHKVNLQANLELTPAVAVAVASASSRPKSNVEKTNGVDYLEQAKSILLYLNKATGRAYRPVKSNLSMIVARLKSGATPEQMREVVFQKCQQWEKDEKMSEFLRPATLFNATKFEQYLGEMR